MFIEPTPTPCGLLGRLSVNIDGVQLYQASRGDARDGYGYCELNFRRSFTAEVFTYIRWFDGLDGDIEWRGRMINGSVLPFGHFARCEGGVERCNKTDEYNQRTNGSPSATVGELPS